MVKNILTTYSSSISNAFFSFLTTAFLSKFFGANGMADIGVFLFISSVILIFSAVFGSSAIVYILPRYQFNSVFYATIISAVLLPFLCVFIFSLFRPTYPYVYWLFFISMVQSIYINALSTFLARQSVLLYNLFRIVQPILLAVGILFLSFVSHRLLISNYFLILLCSYLLPTIIMHFYLLKYLESKTDQKDFLETIKSFLRFGGLAQITNLIQLLNYRIAYIFLTIFCSKQELGTMVLAMSLVDGIWIFKNSISLLKYVDAANQVEDYKLMGKQIKLSLGVTILVITIALVIPNHIYTFVFGDDFGELKLTLLLMSPGVLIMAASSIIANYFSGIGKVHINLMMGLIGLVVFLPCIYFLANEGGLYGVAIANNIPLIIGSLVVFYCYSRHRKSDALPVDLIPTDKSTNK